MLGFGSQAAKGRQRQRHYLIIARCIKKDGGLVIADDRLFLCSRDTFNINDVAGERLSRTALAQIEDCVEKFKKYVWTRE